MRRGISLVVVVALLGAGIWFVRLAPAGASEEGASRVVGASMEAVSWLEGRRAGSQGERRWEEHWSAPDAGGMVGMFRMLEGERVIVYELLMIELETDEGGGARVVHRLRHFGPGMKAWEEGPIEYGLVEATPELILFRNRTEEGPAYIRYMREGGEGGVRVWVGATPEPGERGFTLAMRPVLGGTGE